MLSSNTFALDIRDPKDYFSRENKSQAYRKEWNDSSVMSLQTFNFLLSISFLAYTDFLKKISFIFQNRTRLVGIFYYLFVDLIVFVRRFTFSQSFFSFHNNKCKRNLSW